MNSGYIHRQLTINAGQNNARTVDDTEILNFKAPIVILGDPGLGKSELMRQLAASIDGKIVLAGTFSRADDLTPYLPEPGKPLIIDGLDEITGVTGSPVHEILKKLSKLKYPHFVISCRAADWQGVTERHKILSDYGVEPITFLLSRFSRADASVYLARIVGEDKAENIIEELESNGLEDFFGNPLTLRLIGELVKDGQSLPTSRADLLSSACTLLLSEGNDAHKRAGPALYSNVQMLDAAGAVFAHLLLSGTVGIADLPPSDTPVGFVPISEATDLASSGVVNAAIKSRLFESIGENLFTPVHRIIAEFLAAKWLAKRLSDGLSSRRLFAALNYGDGVPSALRGLHAWLGYFDHNSAPQVMQSDPFGFLRYSDTGRMSRPLAETLLKSLDALADKNPYFRSEDWSRKSIDGLARVDLKNQIEEIITRKGRRSHLSTLLLESIKGAPLAKALAPTLLAIASNEHAIFAERSAAVEALAGSGAPTNWKILIGKLRKEGSQDSKRLAVECAALIHGSGLKPRLLADIILETHRPFSDDDSDHILGTDFLLIKNLGAELSADVLDEIAKTIIKSRSNSYSVPNGSLATTINRLIAVAIGSSRAISAERMWPWLSALGGAEGYGLETKGVIADFLHSNSELRNEIQRFALRPSDTEESNTWVAIHHLARANRALNLTADDCSAFVSDINSKESLSPNDVTRWGSFVLASLPFQDAHENLKAAVQNGVDRHQALRDEYARIRTPPKQDWQREHEERMAHHERERRQRLDEFRTSIEPHKKKIEDGQDLGALYHLAQGYLRQYYELNNDVSPVERLIDWVGAELTDAALSGFEAYLHRKDLPSVTKIAEAHAENKHWHAEPVIYCALLERARLGKSFEDLPIDTIQSALAISWNYPEHSGKGGGAQAQKELERLGLRDEKMAQPFFTNIISPLLAGGMGYIPAIAKLAGNETLRGIAPTLASDWLDKYPSINLSVRQRLFDIVARFSPIEETRKVIASARGQLATNDKEAEYFWYAAAFVFDFEAQQADLELYFRANPNIIWSLRDLIHPREATHAYPVTPEQLGFLVKVFSQMFPLAGHPTGVSSGNQNPWDASDFLHWALNSLGADSSKKSTEVLADLDERSAGSTYGDYIKHIRFNQLRIMRDREFRRVSFQEAKNLLSNSLPAGIDDLKALLIDKLEMAQNYIRNSDTDPWKAFWDHAAPKEENECRDRLLDVLRLKLPLPINFIPEVAMPEKKRADISAVFEQFGVPVEIKGQWHPQVWNAATVQLDEQYARDYRAFGRGIYVVLWFGHTDRKKLARHPRGKSAPKTPEELQRMLMDELPPEKRKLITSVVIDVSRPKAKMPLKTKKRGKQKKQRPKRRKAKRAKARK